MATYYKFAERDADSFVNWAEIGKGLTDMLQEQVKIREDKRTAIDKVTRENLKSLSESPTGDHTSLNTWTLEYADNARQAILLQDRLLKSGALKLKDYTVMRQNLNDGTDELFSVIKNYQNAFKEKRDRMISNDPANKSQALEMDLMAYSEMFGDFSKSKAMIDPNNFMVNIGIMEPDPENKGVMKVGKQIAPSSFLKKIQNTKVDYFDSNAAAETVSKSFGSFITSTIADQENKLQGRVVTIEDVRKRPGYEEAIEDELDSFFSNPFNMTSILTNDLVKDKNGKSYVSNISGKDGNVIEYVFDPQTNYYKPNLTAEQVQAARDYMRRKIEQRLDIKTKEDPFNKPQPQVVKSDDKPSGGGNYAENIDKFKTKLKAVTPKRDKYVFTGTEAITVGNLENLFSSDPALIGKFKVTSDNNVVTVTDNDDLVIGSYDLSKTGGVGNTVSANNLKERERYLDDLINRVTNYSISKDPTIIGVSLMASPQQSGGLNYSDF
jgi:hypothetical protein